MNRKENNKNNSNRGTQMAAWVEQDRAEHTRGATKKGRDKKSETVAIKHAVLEMQ